MKKFDFVFANQNRRGKMQSSEAMTLTTTQTKTERTQLAKLETHDMKTKNNKAPVLAVRCLNRYPGDTAMRLLRAATDEDGKTWPVGTICQPSAAGLAGHRRYQDVRIGTADVRFFA